MFREDGYINVTKVAQHFKKRAVNFLALPSTAEYMEALAEATKVRFSDLAITKRGGAPGQAGTWLHPKMAVALMRWLDVPFSVRADLLIDNILRGNVVATAVVRTQEAEEVTAQFAAMQTRILGLEAENQRLQEEGLREGEIPTGWLTCWNYLEDQQAKADFDHENEKAPNGRGPLCFAAET